MGSDKIVQFLSDGSDKLGSLSPNPRKCSGKGGMDSVILKSRSSNHVCDLGGSTSPLSSLFNCCNMVRRPKRIKIIYTKSFTVLFKIKKINIYFLKLEKLTQIKKYARRYLS